MLRPIDLRSKTCNNISSECVIWDGPDIPCINLCKGDTLEKVTYDLAIEVCKLIDLFNLNGIDTSCLFDVKCKNPTLADLLQYIIDWICRNKDSIGDGSGGGDTNNNLCNEVSKCVFTFTNCDGKTISLPLYSNDGNNLIVYFINEICDLYIQIYNINNQITNINNQIAAINFEITNIWSAISFPVTNVDNCVFTGTITTWAGFISYVNNIAAKLCSLAGAIGFNPSGPYSLSSYNLLCDVLNIQSTTINNLVDLFNFFNNFFSAVCTAIGNINTSITQINTQITNINNTLNSCGCDCPKNVFLSMKYDYTFSNGVYNFSRVTISVVNSSQLSVSGWTVSSITVGVNNLVIADNSTFTTVNSSSITISSSSSLSFDFTGSYFVSLGSDRCPSIINTVNGVRVPDGDISLEALVSVVLTNGTTNCTSYHKISMPLKHCVCGYVESVDFIEGRNNGINILTR